MSATGRGAQRHPDDFYATPAWATRAILPLLGEPITILEPCAGEGAIVDVCREAWGSAQIDAVEVDGDRAGSCGATWTDFLTCGDLRPSPLQPWKRYELAITNPPFKFALPFIQRAREVADVVAMLLRLNFLGSQKRAPFWRENPCGVYVLPKRPSFTGGRTDATEYAWFVWGPGHANRWGVLEVDP